MERARLPPLLPGRRIRVDHRQYPSVYARYAEAGAALDVAELPELYVEQNPMIGGKAIGLDKPFIVITTGAVQQLDEDELRTLLGHELGHVRSGHASTRRSWWC